MTKNKGLIESLNLGISISNGEYIARMDADDISLVNRFEMQLTYMIKNNIDICGCHYYVINEVNHYKNAIIEPIDSDDISLRLSTSVPFAHGSVMIKKSLFDAHKYGQTPFKSVEDYALWIKFKITVIFLVMSMSFYLNTENILNLFLIQRNQKWNLRDVNYLENI